MWSLVRLQPLAVTDKDIVEMIMFPVVNESCRVLAEKIVVQASDLDIASVLGMGFPPYRYKELMCFLSSVSWWLSRLTSPFQVHSYLSRLKF